MLYSLPARGIFYTLYIYGRISQNLIFVVDKFLGRSINVFMVHRLPTLKSRLKIVVCLPRGHACHKLIIPRGQINWNIIYGGGH